MLDFLDNDIPDELRFDVMKKIFFVSASEKIHDRDNPLPVMYIRICRKLSSGAIMVLSTVFYYANNPEYWDAKSISAGDWLNKIGEKSSLVYPDLVKIYEKELMNMNLITPRVYSDGSGVHLGEHFRLTRFGYDLCSYIDAYDYLQ